MTNPFDLKAVLLAARAQHPVIALFIASAVLDMLAFWRKKPVLAAVAGYNLLGAALTLPLAIATGLGSWRWHLEGAALKGNLGGHLVDALISASLILFLCLMRWRCRVRGVSVGVAYAALTLATLILIPVTGHLGGFLSGVETP